MPTWSKLQRRLLCLLEEAGEENLAALTNSVAKPCGLSRELAAMAVALSGLADKGLISVATHRDDKSGRLVSLDKDRATSTVTSLVEYLEWSNRETIWKQQQDSQYVEIILTGLGKSAAELILSQDGWPVRPLEAYE